MPEVTSKDVDRELRRVVWPALKEQGFVRRSGRSAWRDRNDQVDVVRISSFNAYNAGVLGVTSYSFTAEVAVLPRCRVTPRIPTKDGFLRPMEYDCDFRRGLRKRIAQQVTADARIWFIAPDGSNIDDAVSDVGSVLLSDGARWFDELDGIELMLRTAETVQQGDTDETWGMGRIPSPHRSVLVTDLRAALRQRG